MARDVRGEPGLLLTIAPLRGCVAEGLERQLPLELTLWSSPRAQEPLLLQQFT